MHNPLSDPLLDPAQFWVFAYGSLMWRPGFAFAEMQAASLPGYCRDMCFLSVHYGGTAQVPGLVCGLMPEAGAVCRGRAYRIDAAHIETAVRYLDERELITAIYTPRHLEIALVSGPVRARIYVADTSHAQFVGGWSSTEKAKAIARGKGSEGRSLDYLASLVAYLDELGIKDAHMSALLAEARALG